MTHAVKIVDATLREGKQTLQRGLTEQEIFSLAEHIISLGIDQLEVGHAAISKKEVRMLQGLKLRFPGISLMTHARAMISDIEASINAGVDWVGIFISTNEYAKYRIADFSIEKVMEKVALSIAFAKKHHLKVRFTLEDCSRTNQQLAFDLFDQALRAGADRICLADTLGILEPAEVEYAIRTLVNRYGDIPVEVHFHNDRGLAMANALQAITSGASWISSSVNGIGERAGITDTCVLLANLYYKNLRTLPVEANLKEVSHLVADTMGFLVDEHRPVIGEKAFSHVADLHVKAMEKHLSAYNWVNPEIFGQETCIVGSGKGFTPPLTSENDSLTELKI